MKFSFFNPDAFQMAAENEADIQMLTRIVRNRSTCSFQVYSCDPEPNPVDRQNIRFIRADLRMMYVPKEAK